MQRLWALVRIMFRCCLAAKALIGTLGSTAKQSGNNGVTI
jgi:hypothetical protein